MILYGIKNSFLEHFAQMNLVKLAVNAGIYRVRSVSLLLPQIYAKINYVVVVRSKSHKRGAFPGLPNKSWEFGGSA